MKDVTNMVTTIGVTRYDCINILIALNTICGDSAPLYEKFDYAIQRTEVLCDKLDIDISPDTIVYVDLRDYELASLLYIVDTMYLDMHRAPKWLRIYNLLHSETDHESNWRECI